MNLNAARDFFDIPERQSNRLNGLCYPVDASIKASLVNEAARAIKWVAQLSCFNKRCSS